LGRSEVEKKSKKAKEAKRRGIIVIQRASRTSALVESSAPEKRGPSHRKKFDVKALK
jgi:hypothetical protein